MRKSFGGFVKGPKHPSKTKVDAEKMIFYPKRLHYWFLKIAPEKLPKQETVQNQKKAVQQTQSMNFCLAIANGSPFSTIRSKLWDPLACGGKLCFMYNHTFYSLSL